MICGILKICPITFWALAGLAPWRVCIVASDTACSICRLGLVGLANPATLSESCNQFTKSGLSPHSHDFVAWGQGRELHQIDDFLGNRRTDEQVSTGQPSKCPEWAPVGRTASACLECVCPSVCFCTCPERVRVLAPLPLLTCWASMRQGGGRRLRERPAPATTPVHLRLSRQRQGLAGYICGSGMAGRARQRVNTRVRQDIFSADVVQIGVVTGFTATRPVPNTTRALPIVSLRGLPVGFAGLLHRNMSALRLEGGGG